MHPTCAHAGALLASLLTCWQCVCCRVFITKRQMTSTSKFFQNFTRRRTTPRRLSSAGHQGRASPARAPSILMRRRLNTQPQHCMLQQPHPHISQAFRTRLIPATNNQPVLPVAHSRPLPSSLSARPSWTIAASACAALHPPPSLMAPSKSPSRAVRPSKRNAPVPARAP